MARRGDWLYAQRRRRRVNETYPSPFGRRGKTSPEGPSTAPTGENTGDTNRPGN